MKTVSILAYDYAFSSSITGPLDIFNAAGVTWNKIHGIAEKPRFRVEIVGVNKAPATCLGKIKIYPHRAISGQHKTDIILVPAAGGNILKTLEQQRRAIAWIRRSHEQGAIIVAHGNGVFLVAESGILNGKSATTHWATADLFRQRYPLVKLKSDLLLTSDRNIMCSAGGGAWLTVCLDLVKAFAGQKLGTQCAKSIAINLDLSMQAIYSSLRKYKTHNDAQIHEVQEWIEKNFAEELDLHAIAKASGLSLRTLYRRFQSTTGISPWRFVQLAKLEGAKHFLEASQFSIDEIVEKIGYQDTSSFIRLFRRIMGITPSMYRAQFKPG